MYQCTHDPGNGFCFASLLLSMITTSALEHNGRGEKLELKHMSLWPVSWLLFAFCVHEHMCSSASGGHNETITPEQ